MPVGSVGRTFNQSRSFGAVAQKLDAIPAEANAAQLRQLLDNTWPQIARGEVLSKGESAWLQIVAEHPSASVELRALIAERVGSLRPSGAARAANAEAYFNDLRTSAVGLDNKSAHVIGANTSSMSAAVSGAYSRQEGKQTLTALGLLLANTDVAVNPFGKAARGMARLDESLSRQQLGSLLDSEWPKIADYGEASTREVAWLVNLANHPSADASLRLEMADRLQNLPLHREAQKRGARLFVDQLRAFPDAKEVQLDTWYFGPVSASAPPIPPPEASEADLLGLVAGNWGSGGDDGLLDAKELAFFDALSRHPSAGKNFATALMSRVAGQGMSINARRRGAIPFMMRILAQTRMQPDTESDSGATLDLGPIPAGLPDVSTPADAGGLKAMLAANLSKIRRGGWISRGEAAWLLALARQPKANRELLSSIADVLVRARPTKDLRGDTAALMNEIKARLDALPADIKTPDEPSTQALPRLGAPSSKLDPISEGASLAQLKDLFVANQKRIGRGGKWLNPREAAWLIALTQQPAADKELVGQILDYARALKPTKKARQRDLSAHLDAVEALHAMQASEIPLTQLSHTLALVREVATRAAGSDRVLTADELRQAIEPLNVAEKKAINQLFDAFKTSIGGEPLTVPVILAASKQALKQLAAADTDGNLSLDRQEMVGLVALNAAVVGLSRQLLADHGPAGAAYRRFDYGKLSGAPLREAIRDWNGLHNALSYGVARRAMFGQIDNVSGKVRGVYTGREVVTEGIPEAQGTLGMNTEHTMPKSRGVRDTDAISDLHHLFPTDSKTNARRASYPFGVVANTVWRRGESKLGTDKSGRMVFEPPVAQRGDIARALFYVSTVYELPLNASEEATLRAWNLADPVDDSERARNDAINEVQGNRNPFVDDATLASRIADF